MLGNETNGDSLKTVPRTVRCDWSIPEVSGIYRTPLLELIFRAATVHRQFQKIGEVQVCTLLSIKTGACPEDCKYCPQSAHYKTEVKVETLLPIEEVTKMATNAKSAGATRFCMGAAWRHVKNNQDFERVLEMIRTVSGIGLEVCATLGMVTEEQACRLKDAGLYAYNHNLDTSESYYKEIITTRTYQDRLQTLKNVRNADLTVCCGGIVGLGEKEEDRIELLHTLATMSPHPESVPINTLVRVKGTPLEENSQVALFDVVRMIATARILMPQSMVRLSAGRNQMSEEGQALAFLAGANSIFAGDKLLTTPNCGVDADAELFRNLGLSPRPPHADEATYAAAR
jgi:biotin synthase